MVRLRAHGQVLTVAELREALRKMPQDAAVLTEDQLGYSSVASVDVTTGEEDEAGRLVACVLLKRPANWWNHG